MSANKKEFEGEESLYIVNEGEKSKEANYSADKTSLIYPANIKVTKETFSVFELKRKCEVKKEVILDPEYQREIVWSNHQNSELVESILMGIPLPVMYFAEDKFGKLQVIDGQQRLNALFNFLNNKYKISSSPILKDINQKSFNELQPSEQSKLEDYQFIIYVIKPQTPDRIKFDIFDRVNRGGTQLNKQEMRNALYQGKSTKLIKELSETEEFLNATDRGINSKRMKDRYLIVRFIAFYLWRTGVSLHNKEKIEYKSDIDDFLGKTMEILNNFGDEEIEKIRTIFKFSMTNIYNIFGGNSFRIPSDKARRPINMALFDSLGYLACNKVVNYDIQKTKNKAIDLLNDNEFIESITERVDSSNSVKVRFEKIENIINELGKYND
jgi:hypothetical protein